ncbi:hypothetical protein [Nocardia altamirensis]|uniref:hypothetical protein n=1 Tax=Nocardia altamirensis TaxID=472158 RepID=UPI000840023C|nr:hypothetical protein [Nocardia altamirensis]
MFTGVVRKSAESLLDTGSRVQAPLAVKYVDFLRSRRPDQSPAEVARRLEWQYLTTVTTSGVVVGLSAAVPGIGTLIGLAATAAETVFFLEASTVYTLAAAAAHGEDPVQSPRRRELVLGVVLGEGSAEVLARSTARRAKSWDTALADKIPGLRNMKDSASKRFLVRFAAKRAVLLFGRVLPAGIGAVVGGAGNRALGKAVLANARRELGATPLAWPNSTGAYDAV